MLITKPELKVILEGNFSRPGIIDAGVLVPGRGPAVERHWFTSCNYTVHRYSRL